MHRVFKRLAKALIRLHVCVGWSEPSWSHDIVGNLMSQKFSDVDAPSFMFFNRD